VQLLARLEPTFAVSPALVSWLRFTWRLRPSALMPCSPFPRRGMALHYGERGCLTRPHHRPVCSTGACGRVPAQAVACWPDSNAVTSRELPLFISRATLTARGRFTDLPVTPPFRAALGVSAASFWPACSERLERATGPLSVFLSRLSPKEQLPLFAAGPATDAAPPGRTPNGKHL